MRTLLILVLFILFGLIFLGLCQARLHLNPRFLLGGTRRVAISEAFYYSNLQSVENARVPAGG